MPIDILAFQDDSLAALAIVIAQVFVEACPGLAMVLNEVRTRTEPLKLTDQLSVTFTRNAGNGGTQPDSDAITARERDVLSMIGQGHSNKRIARTLEISPETVKSHVKHILSKLAVSTRSEAASKATSLGLLSLVPPSEDLPLNRKRRPAAGDELAPEKFSGS